MHRFSRTILAGIAIAGAGTIGLVGQSASAQTGSQAQAGQAKQVTLTGCLREASDDPRVFALVPATDEAKPTGTTGSAATAPLYRLEDKGQKLKGHVGQRIEVTGTVTPAKDEKGADIIMSRRENIGVDTLTVTTVDLKPAPRLDVTSARKVSGECPAAPAKDTPDAAGTSGATAPRMTTVGEISEHPERFIGETVRVSGEVEKEFSPHVFSLDEDRVFSAGVDVLVLSKKAGVARDDQRVTVTGKLHRFVRAELQREIIDFDLDPEWLVDFESRPVIIATDVEIAQRAR